jgi:hypothetical protein
MQRVVPTHLNFKGTHEDKVFVDSHTYPFHWRKRPVPAKATLRTLKKENKRAAFINNLASELNNIIRLHAGHYKGKDFYHRLLKKFRKESIDNRYLLLRQAEEMRINEKHPEKVWGHYNYDVTQQDNEIIVDLRTTRHFSLAHPGQTSCYQYEVLLITWSKKKQALYHSRQGTDWIQVPGELKKCVFNFSLPNPVSQWLLCIGYICGKDNKPGLDVENRSMEIIKAGTFEEKDLELLKMSKPYKPYWEKNIVITTQEIDLRVTPMNYTPEPGSNSQL